VDIKEALRAVTERRDLSHADMTEVMRSIMTGQATPSQIGGFLIGLRMKGETVDEITAAAQVMRELATPVTVNATHIVDIVGTGGDGVGTFNVSTASCFVAAAAGAHVAKHGNRSVSSKSGSADVLEAAGVRLDLTPPQIARCIEEAGVGFMFAPQHHIAMKHAIGPRREMGVRTVFNLLGPLTNPAGAPNQVVGVFNRAWVEPLAQVLKELGSTRALVVHAEDGIDEFSIAAPAAVAELRNGEIFTYHLSPENVGLRRGELNGLLVKDAAESLEIVRAVLDNQPGAARDIVAFNAGAAIYVAGLADSIAAGVARALEVIASGAARAKLEQLARLSQSFERAANG
jgi:anthranilate phosphoribosyltransferase